MELSKKVDSLIKYFSKSKNRFKHHGNILTLL
jgi:hypothetical protein